MWLSTVYRTMTLFLESGLAQRVDGFHGSRFGASSGHSHLVCLVCDRVEDITSLDRLVIDSDNSAVGPNPVTNIVIQTTCGTWRSPR